MLEFFCVLCGNDTANGRWACSPDLLLVQCYPYTIAVYRPIMIIVCRSEMRVLLIPEYATGLFAIQCRSLCSSSRQIL